MGWTQTGTLNLTNGSKAVVGVGTQFVTQAKIGDGIRGPNGLLYQIDNITGQLAMSIDPAYEGPSVNGAAFMLVPIQGYVKESADRLRVATDTFRDYPLALANKQDKNNKLTAISTAGTVPVQSMPVFTTEAAASMAPVTNRALSLLNQADTPSMQSNLGLIPVSSPTDVTAGRLPTVGWMGLGVVSGNRLPNDTAQVAVPAGIYYTTATWAGSPFAGTDGRNQGYLTVKPWSSPSYMTQTWEPLRRGDAPMMHRYSYNGVWQEWQSILSGTRVQTESLDQKWLMRDVIGIGTPHTYCINIDAVAAPSLILGYSYVSQTTIGTKPGGYVFGVVNTVLNGNDHAQQDFVGLNGVAGTTQRAYRRSGYGTGWGPWQLVIDSFSATYDVEAAAGGVVSRTIVSGCVVNKFASGLIIINGSLGASPVIQANAVSEANLTVPASTGPDTSFATVHCIASPYITNDWFGITNAYMSSPTNLRFILRNGATAQQFGVRGIIIGHWK